MPDLVYEQHPTPYAGNPIIPLSGAPDWYVEQVFDPVVMVNPLDPTQLLMYATGDESPTPIYDMTIGLFTAPINDPLNWTAVGQVLLPSGTPGAFDEGNVRISSVLYRSGVFYMFFSGYPPGITDAAIGLATSTDGVTFTKSGSNPILTRTSGGRDDGGPVQLPAVIEENGTWTMLYAYNSGGSGLVGYRAATASAPTSWTKVGAGDVLSATGGLFFEAHQLQNIGGTYVLMYEAGNFSTDFQIFCATASTATGTYTNSASNPILSGSGVPGSWDRYHVATPWLIYIRGQWYLYYSASGTIEQPYLENTWPMGAALYAMADTFWFNEGARQLQSGGSVTWGSDTIRARLVAAGITPDINDTAMTGYTGLGTDATLSSKSVTNDTANDRTVYTSANATIAGAGASNDYDSVVIYKFDTDDASSLPLFCLAVSGTTDSTDALLALPATGLAYSQQ